MSEKIRPLGGKIVVAVSEPADESVVNGIIVRKSQKRESVREAVVAALPDRYAGTLCVGDTVFIKPFAGAEVIRGGRRLVFLKEAEILAGRED